MPRRKDSKSKLPLAAALLVSLALGACASDPSVPRSAYRGDLGDVEINRIGDLKLSDVEFQDIAMRNAVGHAEGHQVPIEAVERITIVGNEAVGPSLSKSKLGRLNQRTSYRLWMKVVGCDKDIMYTASPAGRLTSVTDEGKCLSSPTATPGAPGSKTAPGGDGLSF